MQDILVIEADLSLCFMLVKTIVQKTTFEAFFATERYQAMELLKHLTPVLLVIAYRLPGMNGIEFYDLLAAQEAFRSVPTLILTDGDPQQEQEVRKRQLESIRKPVNAEEFLMSIQHLLPSRPSIGVAASAG